MQHHPPGRRPLPPLLMFFVLALPLAGCSSQQLYGVGQGWQQQECARRIADAQERSRCMSSAQGSYEQYRQESEAARGTQRP